MSKLFFDCFLLIPTRNRTEFLHKALDFYAQFEACPKIVIADSSGETSFILNEELIQNYGLLEIEHQAFHEDIQIFEKILKCVSYYDNYEYVAIAADDDYFSFDSDIAAQCLGFLRKSEDNAYATGVLVKIKETNLNPPMPIQSIFVRSILSDSPLKRIELYCDLRRNRLYGFHKISILKEALRDTLLVIRREMDTFAEYFLYCSLMLRGKSFCADKISYVFVVHGGNVCLDTERLDLPVCKQSTYDEQLCVATKLLSTAIEKIDKSNRGSELEAQVLKILKRFYGERRSDGKRQKMMSKKRKLYRIVLFPIKLLYFLLEKLHIRQRATVRSKEEWFNLRMQGRNSSFRRMFVRISRVR